MFFIKSLHSWVLALEIADVASFLPTRLQLCRSLGSGYGVRVDERCLVLGRTTGFFLFDVGVTFETGCEGCSDEFVDFASCRTRFLRSFINWSGLGIPGKFF